jgi:hypothetical protein
MTLTDWIGSIGVAILLLAFFLHIRNYLAMNSLSYLLMNVIGSGLACFASALLHYWPFIILEGCWMLVSLFGLVVYRRKKTEI